MNEVLGYLCAHISSAGPREPPEYGEINDITVAEREEKERKARRKYKVSNFANVVIVAKVENGHKRSQTIANGCKRSRMVANARL